MLRNLARLVRYRGLITSLVARELKARYRGSVLGFFWSFINPLLLLLIYSFVFSVVLPGTRPAELEPYALFMFCGILPWTWFSSSLLESSNALIASGNLIRKVMFPAEVLPIGQALYDAGFRLIEVPLNSPVAEVRRVFTAADLDGAVPKVHAVVGADGHHRAGVAEGGDYRLSRRLNDGFHASSR